MRTRLLLLLASALVTACPSPPVGEGDEGEEGEGDEGEGEGDEGEGEGEEGEGEGDVHCEPVVGAVAAVAAVVEGGDIDVDVSCGSGLAADFVVDSVDLPASLHFDADQHLRMSTDHDDAIVVDVYLHHALTHEVATVHIAIADDSLAADNVPPTDPLRYTEEHGLPVVFLSAMPSAESLEPITITADGHTYAATASKLRGASSLGYPKKSVTLKFDKDDRFNLAPRVGQDPAITSTFRDKKKVVLTSTFDDTTFVRQRLAYQLWNRTGHAAGHEHITIGSTSVVVYVGGSYFGLYVLTDHVDRDLFEESLGVSDGGQLYKSTNHDANFRADFPFGGGAKDFLGAGWERRDEPDVDAVVPYADLNAFMDFVIHADDAAFAAGLGRFVARDDMIDWWIFATAILGEDSYGKNAYLYRPDVGQGGGDPVFRYAPWDFNHSFGQAWETSRTDPLTPVDAGWPMDTNGLWARVLADDVAGPAAYAAYADALVSDLAEDRVLAAFDGIAAELAPSAHKDLAVWGDAYAGYFGKAADLDDDTAYARRFIVDRWAYLRGATAP